MRTPEQRLERFFLPKVRKEGNGCWTWLARTTPGGYGVFWNGERLGMAHRFSYEVLIGPIPDGLELDHLCRNPCCVNPAHLEPVTHLENMRRVPSIRTTHCAQGHEYTPENTRHRKNGWRVCRTCDAIWQKRSYLRRVQL